LHVFTPFTRWLMEDGEWLSMLPLTIIEFRP
jgi:hypothetical protein